MATSSSSSSSSSSQGLAPGVGRKRKHTPGDLIIYSLEDLIESDFKRFKNKLSDFTYGDKLPLPRGRLENADWITTKDILIDTYGEKGALDVTIDVFTFIGLMGPAHDLQERREQHDKFKMTHDNKLPDIRKEHREFMKETSQRIPEYNSCMGEAVHLQKRFIELLMRKGPQIKEEKEQEIRSSGRRHLQTIEKRPSDEYSPTTIPALFDPDEDGFIPKIVVLQGPAGIGKTMTSKKIMLDWASEDLYKDNFDFVFYLSCREINTILGDISLVGLLSRTCRMTTDDLVSILEDPGSQRKLLIIVDGFDELRWTLEGKSEGCPDISMKTHKEIILQSLFRRQVLPHSSLIITTRSLAIEKLNTFIADSRNVEIQGFTRDDRKEYVHRFFGNKEDADKVLHIIKENDVVYTMCAVPITCWIVCTVMKQEIKKKYLGSIRCNTTTSIYLLYLEVLLTHHSKKEQSVDSKRICLKKLCALANQGVLTQQILFEKKDLERHGLSLDEVESVFLNENIFHWDVRHQTCYSFIHLSVQEFLAALHYGMDDSWFRFIKGTSLPEICKGGTQVHFNLNYPHLALSVQFLFGLLNENQVKTFSESTGINISLRAKPAMKKWVMEDMSETFHTQAIFCLYETQDEDFIRSSMSGWSSLSLHGSRTGPSWMNSNYFKQLNYCLKTLKRESFPYLRFFLLTLGPECQKILSPFLHRSQEVRIEHCTISGKDCLGEDKAEEEEESSSSEDKMESADLSFLINPGGKIQKLWLEGCGVTSSCCEVLQSILITNRSLIRLDLSQNNLEDSGIKLLCEGLRDPGCTLQGLWLDGCGATSSCCDDLRSILITNRSLTILSLSQNNLQDSGIKLLCEGLRHPSCTLQSLGLGGCDLTSSCCVDLSFILITNRSLISLYLSNNNLEDSGIKHLCEGLKHPGCTLQDLSFTTCKVTLWCCDILCSLITTNRTLKKLQLTLDDEKMSDSEVRHCYEVLRKAGFHLGRREAGWICIHYRRK